MKKIEFCEIVNPPHYWDLNGNLSKPDSAFVTLGTTNMGSANLLKDEKGNIKYFGHYIDAINWLSKQGWYLSKTFITKEENGNWVHCVMAREIKIDD